MARIDRLTDDAVALTFAVPEVLGADYAFSPGQHVTLRCLAAGDDGRRTYSLCAAPGELRIGVKQVPGGVFSTHALTTLTVGDEVEVMTPSGHFTTTIDASASRHRAAIAAGSGITPVLSIVTTTLAAEPASRFTLVYGSRTSGSVMFLDELADLKDRYPARLQVVHVLSREPRDAPLLSGRLDRAKIDALLDAVVEVDTVEEWFVCGPLPVIDAARAALRARGVPDRDVHFELFHIRLGEPAASEIAAETAEAVDSAEVVITLAGRSTTLQVPRDHDVLHAALRVRPDVPFGCTNGMCGTCRAKVVEGGAQMAHCYALDEQELADGFVLTCQARPRSDRLVLDYDA